MSIQIIKRVKRFIPRSSFMRNVSLLFSGTASGQLIVLASSPLLTRLYSPAEFGVFGMYVAIVGVIIVAVSLCYEMAIPLAENDHMAANVLFLSILVAGVVSLACLLAVGWFRGTVADAAHMPQLTHYLWLLPLSLFGGAIYNALVHWAIRSNSFAMIAKTKLSQSTTQASAQVGLGLLHGTAFGLFIGDALGRISGSFTLWRLIRKRHSNKLRSYITWNSVRKVAYRYRRFPLLSSHSVLLNSIGQHLPSIWLALTYSSQVVGWFVLSLRVLGMPVALISSSVGEVFYAELVRMSNDMKDSTEKMSALFWKTLRNMFLLGIPFLVPVTLLAPYGIAFIFGEQWRQAGTFISCLSIMFFFQFLSIAVGSSIVALERQELHLIREVIRTFLIVGTIFVSQYRHMEPLTAVMLYSFIGTIGYLVHLAISWLSITQHVARKKKVKMMEEK